MTLEYRHDAWTWVNVSSHLASFMSPCIFYIVLRTLHYFASFCVRLLFVASFCRPLHFLHSFACIILFCIILCVFAFCCIDLHALYYFALVLHLLSLHSCACIGGLWNLTSWFSLCLRGLLRRHSLLLSLLVDRLRIATLGLFLLQLKMSLGLSSRYVLF